MICKKCSKEFEVNSTEIQIRAEIQVDKPDLCPRCRLENKYSQISGYKFQEVKCSVCGNKVVTANPMVRNRPVACKKCYITEVLDQQNSD